MKQIPRISGYSLGFVFSIFTLSVFTVTTNTIYLKSIDHPDQQVNDSLIPSILKTHPEQFQDLLNRKDEFNIQIIYTTIDRKKNKNSGPVLKNHFYNVDDQRYFYPASTVKLPVAILALQKLNELNIPGLDMNTTMLTGEEGNGQTAVDKDPSALDSRPTIAHYIKKILLVSDNDAFNRLYEFLGQEYINYSLHKMGYESSQVIHRLSISLTEDQNRHTNPVSFYDDKGKLLYSKPAERSRLIYAPRNTKMGVGYMQGDKLINEPFDFSKKNRFLLTDLHMVVKSIFFPSSINRKQRFNLNEENYQFLRRYMSMRPGESVSPAYSQPEYWDNYVKMIYYGTEKSNPDPHIRIFSKTGTAYGFLIESAYFADFKNGIEFFLSAVIYCNSDGIFNDDKYDYAGIGYPFFKNLGHAIYEYELKREKKHSPGLDPFRFIYAP